jgi:hypothetical protein
MYNGHNNRLNDELMLYLFSVDMCFSDVWFYPL